MGDGMSVYHVPAFSESLEVDVSRVRSAIQACKEKRVLFTYTHVLIRAAALVLAANPALHVMVCGRRVYNPAEIDIALSLSGDSFMTPVLLIRNAGVRTVSEIARAVRDDAPAAREETRDLMRLLDRWGWVLPFGFLRRRFLRFVSTRFAIRHKGSGTFQVSVLPTIDYGSSAVFSAGAVLCAGGVRNRPIVMDGQLATAWTIILTCCADHRVWNGRAAARFLNSMREVLQSDRLLSEIRATDIEDCAADHAKA
jgi:pyruvate dehydrogenase E2 component (dihydrolipoamide acetyltransferase)